MTRAQQDGQMREAAQFESERLYKCPDCGEQAYFMGLDFKAPKKSDARAWRWAQTVINSGKVFYRGMRT